jgi:CubicO group peptidase (beta-lactamase class C family)
MKRIIWILSICLFVITSFKTVSASSNPHVPLAAEELDAFIEAQMRRHNLPGVAVAVTQGEELVDMKGFGQAAKGQAMTVDTPLYIGSLSKSFTALAVMQLHEQGKLDIDMPVKTYLPEFEIADTEAMKTITIRNLLNHVSGLSDFSYIPQHGNDISIMDGIKEMGEAELSAPIGSTFQYFNSNYAILGAVIEKVSGMWYGDYIQENIYTPLGMDNSYTDQSEAERAGLPSGYTSVFGFSLARKQPFRQYDLPGGYLMMSVRDLSKYLRMQVNNGTFNGVTVLAPEWVEEMHTPQAGLDVPYGMGWFSYDDFGTPLIEHGGTNENFHTSGMIFPEKEMTIAILVNKNSIFHALFSHPNLNYGVKGIAIGLPMPKEIIPLRLVGYAMLAGFLINIVTSARVWFKMDAWMQSFKKKKTIGQAWDIGSHFITPAALVVLLPIGIELFLNRGFTWQAGWSQAPDGILWLWTGIVLDLVTGVLKIMTSMRHKKTNLKLLLGIKKTDD